MLEGHSPDMYIFMCRTYGAQNFCFVTYYKRNGALPLINFFFIFKKRCVSTEMFVKKIVRKNIEGRSPDTYIKFLG